MKKVIVMFAFASFMVACGGASKEESTTDSTAVQVDTAAVTAVDTTTAQIPAGGSVEATPVK